MNVIIAMEQFVTSVKVAIKINYKYLIIKLCLIVSFSVITLVIPVAPGVLLILMTHADMQIL